MEFTSGALSARFLLLRVVVVLFGKKGSKGSEIKRTKLLLQSVDKLGIQNAVKFLVKK